MNKREYIKYHTEVKDKYDNPLQVGDVVAIHDGYSRDVHIGIIHHFAEKTVIVNYREGKWNMSAQKWAKRMVKIEKGYELFPYLDEYLDDYGKELIKTNRNGQICNM